MGHRNVQGLYYDKKSNVIISSEHGPEGGDEININVNPSTAAEEDNYTIVTTYDPLGVPDSFTAIVNNVSGTFQLQETITGSASANSGEVGSWLPLVPDPNSTVGIAIPSGYFQIGETLTGTTSGATATIVSYT